MKHFIYNNKKFYIDSNHWQCLHTQKKADVDITERFGQSGLSQLVCVFHLVAGNLPSVPVT